MYKMFYKFYIHCEYFLLGILYKPNTISIKEAKSHLLPLVYCDFPFPICQDTHFNQQYQRDIFCSKFRSHR
jgi:hypothetical protein